VGKSLDGKNCHFMNNEGRDEARTLINEINSLPVSVLKTFGSTIKYEFEVNQ
jgi:hypothetical protein